MSYRLDLCQFYRCFYGKSYRINFAWLSATQMMLTARWWRDHTPAHSRQQFNAAYQVFLFAVAQLQFTIATSSTPSDWRKETESFKNFTLRLHVNFTYVATPFKNCILMESRIVHDFRIPWGMIFLTYWIVMNEFAIRVKTGRGREYLGAAFLYLFLYMYIYICELFFWWRSSHLCFSVDCLIVALKTREVLTQLRALPTS